MNICVQISAWMYAVISLGIYLEIELVGHIVIYV